METHHDGQVIRIFDLRHLVGNRVETVGAEDIVDTQRIEEAAEIFKSILEGKGTYEKNAVVLSNAAMALKNTEKYGDYEKCLMMAKESLMEGKALNCLNILID